MTTALDLIKSSLRLLRVQDADETPTASDSATALFALNAMLGQWSARVSDLYQTTEIIVPLVAGQSTYTVGAGMDITQAITRVEQSFVRISNTDLIVTVATNAEYNDITNKTTQGQPLTLTYNRQESVVVWPVPNQAYSLHLVVLAPFTSLALADTLVYPAEYLNALRYSLARDLCDEYAATWTATLQDKYVDAVDAMKVMNFSQAVRRATFDLPTSGRGDATWRRANFPV
jgi:hypothetical protein